MFGENSKINEQDNPDQDNVAFLQGACQRLGIGTTVKESTSPKVAEKNLDAALEASGAAQDAYASFDQTAGRIENRLRRYKQRLKGRSGSPGSRGEASYSVLAAPDDESIEEEGYHPMVIAETTKPLHAFSVSDAVMQLDMTGAPALVFIHASTGRVNVVYRRGDGAIGWVDPPLAQP